MNISAGENDLLKEVDVEMVLSIIFVLLLFFVFKDSVQVFAVCKSKFTAEA